MKTAKGGKKKSLFIVTVLENKAITPADLRTAVEKIDFSYEGVEIEAAGIVEKAGEEFTFKQRGNDQKFALKANDELKKLVADGKTHLLVKGEIVEPKKEDEGEPKPLVIEVSAASEVKEEPKPEPPKEEKKEEDPK